MGRREMTLGFGNGYWEGGGARKRGGHERRNGFGTVNAPFGVGYSDVPKRSHCALQVLTEETGCETICLEVPGEAPGQGRWQRRRHREGRGLAQSWHVKKVGIKEFPVTETKSGGDLLSDAEPGRMRVRPVC